MKPVVVIPTYNERANLPELVERLRAAVDATLLVVDDGSPDGTADLAEELGRAQGDVRVLRRAGKGGLASAYVAGFGAALDSGAQRIVQMDADLSHDPADVPRLLATDADLAIGSRYVSGGRTRGWPLHREALSRLGSLYARAWLGLPHQDLTGGFKAWRATALRTARERPLRCEGYAFQVEMTLRSARGGHSVIEVPIVFSERAVGQSKMSPGIAIEALRVLPTLRWS
jgi:dolichol-phosphate mannosyltransferase